MVGAELSTDLDGTGDALAKLKDQLKDSHRRYQAMAKRWLSAVADNFIEASESISNTRFVVVRWHDEEPELFKQLVAEMARRPDTLALLMNERGETAQLAFCSSESSQSEESGLRPGEMIHPLLAVVDGKGGGKGNIWQGVALNPAGWDSLVSELRVEIQARLSS